MRSYWRDVGPGRDTLWLGFKTARWLLCAEEAVSRRVGDGVAGRSAQGRQEYTNGRLGSGARTNGARGRTGGRKRGSGSPCSPRADTPAAADTAPTWARRSLQARSRGALGAGAWAGVPQPAVPPPAPRRPAAEGWSGTGPPAYAPP